jgi:hypothetical protein
MVTSDHKIPEEAEADDLAVVEAFLDSHPDEWSLTHEDPEGEVFCPPGFRWATADGREPLPDSAAPRSEIEHHEEGMT